MGICIRLSGTCIGRVILVIPVKQKTLKKNLKPSHVLKIAAQKTKIAFNMKYWKMDAKRDGKRSLGTQLLINIISLSVLKYLRTFLEQPGKQRPTVNQKEAIFFELQATRQMVVRNLLIGLLRVPGVLRNGVALGLT